MRDIHQTIADLAQRGVRFAVAVVLRAEGSTPCKAGAKAAVEADGTIHGTVGGGQVEAVTQQRAVEAVRTGRHAIFDFNLEGEVQGGGPVCGGTMRVLVFPVEARHASAYAAAAEARRRRTEGLLLTAIRGEGEPSVEVWFHAARANPRELGVSKTAARRSISADEPPYHCVVSSPQPWGKRELFAEVVIPQPLLVIVGGGHVGWALAEQAVLVGFDVMVLDDRPEFADPARFPADVTTRCGPLDAELAALATDADTYAVIVTRSHDLDAQALAALLGKPLAYLGMIGSRRKVAMIRRRLIESGRATAADLDRVRAPIGLEIGAQTVSEIAVSIVAQLIAVRRKAPAARPPSY